MKTNFIDEAPIKKRERKWGKKCILRSVFDHEKDKELLKINRKGKLSRKKIGRLH